jgi:hypothetical protein
VKLKAVLLVLAVVSCTRGAGHTDTARASDVHGPLSADSLAARIDHRMTQLRHDTVTVFDLSAEGARITASYSGDSLRRLHARYLGETGRATETYYFDSTLFLVIRSDERYSEPLTGRVVDSSTTRFDLTAAGTPKTLVDSLEAEARILLGRIRRR